MFETAMFLELMEKVRDLCHKNAVDHGFWDEQEDELASTTDKNLWVKVKHKPWNFGEKIALIHSELSEMFEAWRKHISSSDKPINIIDPKYISSEDSTGIRRITAIEEEMADTFIRLFDLCGKLDIDIGRVILAKMEYNKSRPIMHGGRKC